MKEVFDDTLADIEVPAFLEDVTFEDDFGAPEAGSFKPRLYPGKYRARFELNPVIDRKTKKPVPGGLGSIAVDSKTYPQIAYTVYVQTKDLPDDVFTEGRIEGEIRVPFGTASGYVTKLGISGIGQLCRTFGFHALTGREKPLTLREAIEWLKSVSGQVTGPVAIGWKVYDKAGGFEISTSPNTKRKNKSGQLNPDYPWPIESVEGKKRPAMVVTLSDEQQAFGRETVTGLLLPTAKTLQKSLPAVKNP